MPLLIDLKPGEKVVVNGAVIENAGATTKLRIHNHCNILRQKEILTEADVVTPAARVYFCLQNAYIFQDQRERHLLAFEQFLRQYVEACPSATPVAEEIVAEVAALQDYRALRAARKLIQHEAMVVDRLRQAMEGQEPPTADDAATLPE